MIYFVLPIPLEMIGVVFVLSVTKRCLGRGNGGLSRDSRDIMHFVYMYLVCIHIRMTYVDELYVVYAALVR